MDDLNGQLREVRADISSVWAELRKEIRAGDNRANLLTRLDERFLDANRRTDERLADFGRRFDEWRKESKTEQENDNKKLITREEFDPVKKAVYALIFSLCMAVLGAIYKSVMK